MDKLLSSSTKDHNNEEQRSSKDSENVVTNRDASDQVDEATDNQESGLTAENDVIEESKVCKDLVNETAENDMTSTDAEKDTIKADDEMIDAVADETVEPIETADNESEPKVDEQPAIVEESNTDEIEGNDAETEAGGMLRAAVDGLPVDLDCQKQDEEMKPEEDQIESDSKPEECEMKEGLEATDNSNQGKIIII